MIMRMNCNRVNIYCCFVLYIVEMSQRFVCGMRRFDKHKISTDRVTDSVMQSEQDQRLAEMLKQRELQDQGQFSPQLPLYMPAKSHTDQYTKENEKKIGPS